MHVRMSEKSEKLRKWRSVSMLKKVLVEKCKQKAKTAEEKRKSKSLRFTARSVAQELDCRLLQGNAKKTARGIKGKHNTFYAFLLGSRVSIGIVKNVVEVENEDEIDSQILPVLLRRRLGIPWDNLGVNRAFIWFTHCNKPLWNFFTIVIHSIKIRD